MVRIICPVCQGTTWWLLKTGKKRCSACRYTAKSPTRNLLSKTRISSFWKGKLNDYFSLGVPVYRLRFKTPYSLPTIERYYRLLRELIYKDSLKELEILSGQIEVDETLFGGKNIPGKKGWGASGKQLVFGIYQRNGKVLTFPISSRGRRTLIPLILKHIKHGSLYYTDDWFAYTSLDIRGNHVVVEKQKGLPKGRDHLNGIEGFWSYAKHHLYHYRGVPKKYFHLYLKEVEWRFNHRNEDLLQVLRILLNQDIKVHEV